MLIAKMMTASKSIPRNCGIESFDSIFVRRSNLFLESNKIKRVSRKKLYIYIYIPKGTKKDRNHHQSA